MNDIANEARFSIKSSFENVANLAEDVSVLCGNQPGVNSDLTDSVRLCVAEALNNIVEHAYEGVEGKPIFADVRFFKDKLAVLLIDEGKPMPDGQIPVGSGEFDLDDFENLPEGGFGWMLIRSQMDRLDYERREGCNVLLMEMNTAG